MTQLVKDVQRTFEDLELQEFGVDTSAVIYEGAAVGLNASTKLARQLVAGDLFLGHALSRADNTGTSVLAGMTTVRSTVRLRAMDYGCLLAVTGATDAGDIGKPVYASDSDTYTLTATSNSYVGRISRYDSVTGKFVVGIDRATTHGTLGAALTSAAGTAGAGTADVTASFSQSVLNNNFATIVARVAAIEAMLK